MGKKREYGFDNLRGILIFLVVLGHLLESCGSFRGAGFLYRTIYAFHMPAFLFLTGYFARYDREKIIQGMLIPFILFQTAYLLFDGWLNNGEVELQYTMPHWLLWYLMVCIGCHLLLPMYETDAFRQQLLALGITFSLSLLAGFDETVGYRLSLSRFLVFQPWFLLGYYCRCGGWLGMIDRWDRDRLLLLKLLLTAAVCVLALLMHLFAFRPELLYGAHSYGNLDYGPAERLVAGIAALAWIGFGFLVLLPLVRWRLPMLTALGQNTMPVYLLHGFVVRYIQKRQPGMLETPWQVLLVAVLILAVLGNPVTGAVFRDIFSGKRTRVAVPRNLCPHRMVTE